MAARPASGTTWGFVHFFARSSRHILAEEGTRFIYSPIHLAFHFDIRHQFKSALTTTIIKTSRQKSNLSSAFDISSRRSQQNIYIDVRDDDHSGSVEHAAPRHARIVCRCYAAEPLLRRACCSAARPHHFAELLLRNSAAPTPPPSAFAPRHPASFCGYYAYDTPPC